MSLFIPKPKPLYAPMLATFGGGSAKGFNSGAKVVPALPTPTLVHLEDPGSNYYTSNNRWYATVGSNTSFIGGGFTKATDGNGNSYLKFPSPNSVQSFGFISDLTLPSNMCIITVIEEESSNPLIIEHSQDANSNNGMYHYSDTGYTYGVRRSGTFAGYNASNSGGSGTEDPVNNATKTIFGSNFTSSSDLTDVFYSSKFGGKRNAVLSNGSAITNGSTNKTLYIGGRSGSSILFTGKLYEIYMTAVLSASDFDDAIAYFEDKFGL